MTDDDDAAKTAKAACADAARKLLRVYDEYPELLERLSQDEINSLRKMATWDREQ